MFAHLHVHTQYSLLDGLSHIPNLVSRAKDEGFNALAITDHGNLYGVVEFYSKCREAGINPVIGCEVYVAQGSRHDRSPSEKTPYHLTMMARNNVGYRNLMQLVTKAHMEGFYYKPRIDRELLEQYHEGLVVFSGCPTAQVPRLIKEHRLDDARKEALWHKELFGDGYFLELQRHAHVEHLDTINETLTGMSRELDIPMVVTNDCHYVDKQDAPLQDVLICIHTSTNINDDKRLKMEDDSYYLKSAQEMLELFPDHPDAVANTQRIAEMCHVELGFGQLHLPQFPLPEGFDDADDYLAHLCWEGFARRYPVPPAGAREKLLHELDVIRQTRFANYFLVVWDIVDFTRKNNILLGVRGSAASSVALYCLGVTEIDPVEYRLVFERFLNIERKEMPDIDMDFQDDRRDEVLRYVTHRYGSDKVAQIITFGTLGTKASLRDVGRALGMSYASVDRVARLVPFRARNVRDAVESSPELKEIYESDYAIKDLVDKAEGLEGTAHHVSTHAAGVVISSEPLTEYVPLQRPTKADAGNEISMTQYSMEPVAMLGLLKMDFLGLTSLTILDRAVKSVKETRGIEIDLHQLSLDDEITFQLLSSGKTTDIFQLESAGMQRYIKDLKPSSLGDISAMIALYRPGPMEHIDRFIQSKHGRADITYPHPSLEDVLEETYGIIVYQEQVLLILQNLAGYSAGEADIVRKAMGKKNAELMMAERDRFIQGAISNGFDQAIAIEVFNLIEPFAGYAFNKAHSISYALVSYWTAYFKAHYPVEYMGAVLNSRLDHPERMAIAINDCAQMGIRILPPDVNSSGVFFTIEYGPEGPRALRFGMSAVKNVGEGAVQPVVAEREKDGPFSSIEEFCHRVDMRSLNRRALESLVKVGAFDAMGQRQSLLDNLGPTLASAQRDARIKSTGQSSMFDLMGEGEQEAEASVAPQPVVSQGRPSPEQSAWEKELLGFALSSNPAQILADMPTNGAVVARDQLDSDMDGQRVKIMGLVSTSEQRYTREQKAYAITTMEMIGGTLEVIAWPDALERTRDVWQEGLILSISGRLRLRGERLSLHCDEATICASGEDTGQPDDLYEEDPFLGEMEYQATGSFQSDSASISEPPSNGYHVTAGESPPPEGPLPEGSEQAQPTAPLNGTTVMAAGEQAKSERPSGGVRTSGNHNGKSNGNGYSNGNGHANGNGKSNGNGHSTNGHNGNGQNGKANGNGNGHYRTVFISLHESADSDEDVQRLNDVKKLLLEYPGADHVNLTIQTQQGPLHMDWPLINTNYCDDLHTSLDQLLGTGAVQVEDTRPNGN